MPQIQAAGSPRPSQRPAPFQTATNVSCTASATTSGSAHRRRRRAVTQATWRSCSSRSAPRSPSATAASSSWSVRNPTPLPPPTTLPRPSSGRRIAHGVDAVVARLGLVATTRLSRPRPAPVHERWRRNSTWSLASAPVSMPLAIRALIAQNRLRRRAARGLRRSTDRPAAAPPQQQSTDTCVHRRRAAYPQTRPLTADGAGGAHPRSAGIPSSSASAQTTENGGSSGRRRVVQAPLGPNTEILGSSDQRHCPIIDAHRAEFHVVDLCGVGGVSTSGFFDRQARRAVRRRAAGYAPRSATRTAARRPTSFEQTLKSLRWQHDPCPPRRGLFTRAGRRGRLGATCEEVLCGPFPIAWLGVAGAACSGLVAPGWMSVRRWELLGPGERQTGRDAPRPDACCRRHVCCLRGRRRAERRSDGPRRARRA